MNSTLGSIVPVTMFLKGAVSARAKWDPVGIPLDPLGQFLDVNGDPSPSLKTTSQ